MAATRFPAPILERVCPAPRHTASVAAVVLGLCAPVSAGAADAVRQVQAGIQHHAAGDFEAAQAAFAEAAQAIPDSPRVIYDQACVLAAQGRLNEAEKLFGQARLAPDPQVVAASHYNLGCIAAERARAKLGTQPEEASPEVRREVAGFVDQAVSAYRASLRVNPEHEGARHNLELLRLWMKHMQDAWRRRDRDRQRQSLGLLEFLEMIQTRQQQLRQSARDITREEDSPRRRQAARLVGEAQRELAEEIGPLQEKIRAAASPPPAGGAVAGSAAVDPRQQEVVEGLIATAGQARTEMSRATVELNTNEPRRATEAQGRSLDHLDTLYRAVAPWDRLLQRAVAGQQRLIDASPAADSQAAGSGAAGVPGAETSRSKGPAAGQATGGGRGGTGARPGQDEREARADQEAAEEAAGDEARVAGWTEALTGKAAVELEAAAAAAKPEDAGPAGGVPPATDPPAAATKPGGAAESPGAPPPPLEALRKAVTLGPRAQAAATAAAEKLRAADWGAALPKQEEALKLLKEIAGALPPPPPQEGEKPPSQPDQPPQESPGQNDRQENDQEPESQPSKQEPPPEQRNQDSPRKDQPASAPRDRSIPQVEALLQQVREREREYKERQRNLRALMRGGAKVDKDW